MSDLNTSEVNYVISGVHCPHCGVSISINSGRLVRDHGLHTTLCYNCRKTIWMEQVSGVWQLAKSEYSALAEPAAEGRADVVEPRWTTAASICSDAAQLVGGDRQVKHGDKTINFANTADMWTAILKAKLRQAGIPSTVAIEFELTALDVGNMLEAFKIARRYCGSHNLDDYIDGAGYAGCAGEIAERQFKDA